MCKCNVCNNSDDDYDMDIMRALNDYEGEDKDGS